MRIFALFTLLAAAVPGIAQQGNDNQIFETTLDNGLHIIVRKVIGADMTTVMTLYDTGELHEPAGRSGIAHLTEHLLVTCATSETDAMTAEQWFGIYRSAANAQTGLDYTVVAVSVPNDALESELAKAAARLQGLDITQADLDREKPRVLTELQHMYSGPPTLAARNRARQLTDPSPEGARRGGTVADLNALTVEQMQRWYSDYYRTNNATLIIVGDIQLDTTADMIGRHFAALEPGKDLPEPRERPAPTLNVQKSFKVDGDGATGGVVTVAIPAPELTSPEYGMFLLVVPRIYQQMLMKGIKPSGSTPPVVYTPLDDPGAVYITHAIESEAEAQAAIATVWACIDAACTFKTQGPLDRSAFQYAYAPMLHVVRVPDQSIGLNTYGEALRLGRFRQLDLTSELLRRHVQLPGADTINAAAPKLFAPDRAATVVVTTAAPK